MDALRIRKVRIWTRLRTTYFNCSEWTRRIYSYYSDREMHTLSIQKTFVCFI